MGDPESSQLPVGIGGTIPHFFFDVIGRITPGAFLLVGIYLVGNPGTLECHMEKALGFFPKEGATAGIFFFLLFLASAYFAGFYLGAVSFCFEWLWARPEKNKWRLSDIPHGLWREGKGATETEISLDGKHWTVVGMTDVHKRVVRIAELCAFYTWAVNPTAASFASRWDAEALASRSVLLTSIGLLFWSVIKWQLLTSAVMLAIGIAAGVSFDYSRRRRILAKLEIVQALPRGESK
jgi:hypothetical protein